VSRSLRNRAFLIIVLVFSLPYFFAIFVSGFKLALPKEFLELVARSFLQAASSALFAIVLGLLGASALLRRSVKWEALALAPAAVPSIAIVLGFMSAFPGWRGWSAVAFAHALVSSGLVAVVLSRVIRGHLGGSLELAWVEGASRTDIWFRGVLPAIRPDLARLATTVFAASLASFSIPLLLSGARAVTFEIAILQAIRLDGSWETAAALSIFQWGILLLTVLLLGRTEGATPNAIESEGRTQVGRVLGSELAFPTLLIAPLLILFALLRAPLLGWNQLQSAGLFENSDFLLLNLRGSLVTATLAGVFCALLLAAFAAVGPTPRQRAWLSGYVAPSTAITGFATLVIGWGSDPSFTLDALRISTGGALLFAPILWRLRWEQKLSRLDGQVAVAQTLGASHGMIVRRILFPQLREILLWSIGLVSFWMWGDYAIGSIAASRPMTLGLVAKGLLESYRLEAASAVIICCLLFGGLSYRLFTWGGSRDVS
jgi:ABC-type Fe3+ transport system permease subunit